MTRVLVTYATKHGSTAEIAGVIADAMRERGLDVDVRPAKEVESLYGFDAAVIGSAVYMDRWQGDALELLKRFERELGCIPVWLFGSGPTGGTPESDAKAREILVAQPAPPGDAGKRGTKLGMRGYATFGGRVGPEMTGLLERWMPRGDWRDFDQVRSWASKLASELGASDLS